MPLPTPRSGEGQDDFMARCMHEADTPTDNDQRLAVCFSQWRRKKMADADRAMLDQFVDALNHEHQVQH